MTAPVTLTHRTSCLLTEITGGGLLFNKTGNKAVFAGANWLRDGHSGTITWNCFVEGNLTGPIPWNNWRIHFNENMTKSIGFVNNETRWGFYVGEHQ
jgi:hypothetical protein